MCSASGLCDWAKGGRTRREVVALLRVHQVRPSVAAKMLGKRPDGSRVDAVQARRVRLEAERRGCLGPRPRAYTGRPPAPLEVAMPRRGFPLGAVWAPTWPPSRVPLPVAPPAPATPPQEPARRRERLEALAWSRPINPMLEA